MKKHVKSQKHRKRNVGKKSSMTSKEVSLLMKPKQLTEKQRKLYKQINAFGPFVHGTSTNFSEKIDVEGLKPRGDEPSIWELSGIPSMSDTLYLASVSNGIGQAIGNVEYTVENVGGVFSDAWNKEYGVYYVIEKIRPEWLEYLTIDEDCLTHSKDKNCKTALDSLISIGSLGIKVRIPRKYMKKMTPREFFEYSKKYNEHTRDKTFKEFITDRILVISGQSGLDWEKEMNPHLFE